MTTLVFQLSFTIVVMIVLTKSLKIAAEGERFAIFTLGRFHSYAGPGLIVIIPFTQQVMRLKVGDIGSLISREFAAFDNVNIPVSGTESIGIGQAVRIDGFDDTEPRLVPSSIRSSNHCPKCGHEF